MRRPTPDKKPKREEPYDFSIARYASIDFLPYLYSHVASLIPVQRPGLETIAVDQHMRVYYDPAVFDKWTLPQATAVILHEDMHVLLGHCKRCQEYLGDGMTPQQWDDWNIAADLVVNQTLEKVKNSKGHPLPLPEEGTFLKDYEGFEPNLSVEEYYELLAERHEPPPPGQGEPSDEPSDEPGDEPGPGGGQGQPQDDQDKEDQEDQDQPQDGDDEQDQPPPPGGGSGADGQPRPWEDPPPDECDTPGMDDYNQQMLQQEAARKTEEWESKNRGRTPGYLKRFCEEILRPKVDPFKALRAAVRRGVVQQGSGDYTYAKRSKRNPPGAAILPGAIKHVPRAVVIVDTSGSMGPKDLAKALGVIQNGLRSVPARGIKVISGDTDIRSVQKVFRAQDVTPIGGGGTEMGIIIEAAAKEKPAPDAIVCVTDGETDWPDKPVRPKVVACLTRESTYCGPPPAWMTKVVLKD